MLRGRLANPTKGFARSIPGIAGDGEDGTSAAGTLRSEGQGGRTVCPAAIVIGNETPASENSEPLRFADETVTFEPLAVKLLD